MKMLKNVVFIFTAVKWLFIILMLLFVFGGLGNAFNFLRRTPPDPVEPVAAISAQIEPQYARMSFWDFMFKRNPDTGAGGPLSGWAERMNSFSNIPWGIVFIVIIALIVLLVISKIWKNFKG